MGLGAAGVPSPEPWDTQCSCVTHPREQLCSLGGVLPSGGCRAKAKRWGEMTNVLSFQGTGAALPPPNWDLLKRSKSSPTCAKSIFKSAILPPSPIPHPSQEQGWTLLRKVFRVINRMGWLAPEPCVPTGFLAAGSLSRPRLGSGCPRVTAGRARPG